MIGNHVLIPKSVNIQGSNKSFKEKKEIYNNEKGKMQDFIEIKNIMKMDDFTPKELKEKNKEYARKIAVFLKDKGLLRKDN